MIENIDNLPPEFWTENELDQMALEAIEIDKYVEQKQVPPKTDDISACKYCDYKGQCRNDG